MIGEILEENKHRRYPFVEDSDTKGLPDCILLDIRLVNVAADNPGSSKLLCTSYSVTRETVTLSFEYRDKDGTSLAVFDLQAATSAGINFGTLNVSENIVVKFAMCGIEDMEAVTRFSGPVDVEAEIIKTRIVEIQKESRVTSIGGASGVLHVTDGYNTTARIDGNSIVVSIKNGSGAGNNCVEEDDNAFDCSKALMFINGQHAGSDGNINIVGGGGVSVQTGKNAFVNGEVVPAIVIRAADTVGGLR